MTVNEYLNTHKTVHKINTYEYVDMRPRIVCADGWSISVQASQNHYCAPKDNDGPYSKVELGYPSAEDPDLTPYTEMPGADPLDSVYPYVDVELIEQVIAKHGGIAS